RKGEHRRELEQFGKQGFVRARIDGTLYDLADEIELAKSRPHDIDLVVDRLVVNPSVRGRLTESIETALRLAEGLLLLDVGPGRYEQLLSERNACLDCGVSLPEIEPRLFSFNSPHGACEACSGLGTRRELDPDRVVPDPGRPLGRGAIEPWRGRRAGHYYAQLLASLARHFDADLEAPWRDLPKRVRDGILYGTGGDEVAFAFDHGGRTETVKRRWDGVMGELERRRGPGEPDAAQDELARYESPRPCPECEGSRLRPEARHVRVAGLGIHELCALPIAGAIDVLDGLSLTATQQAIADRILREIGERLRFLCDVGLDYLTLDRSSASLSGGEGQRIRLATQVGSSLVGVLYILDEPSIGMHARDTARLLATLFRLRDLGNSVIVVEHDEAMIRAADWVIDMGPGAGIHGGTVVAEGGVEEIESDDASLTGHYLSGRRAVPLPAQRRRPGKRAVRLTGCREHNLKDIVFELPLGLFTVVTGVSGSGKSTLVNDIFQRALAQRLHGAKEPPGRFERIQGLEHVDKVIDVNQAPIGRTPRSNPVTYTGVFDGIRKLFAQVPEARVRGYGAGRFSFNVKGGRCESCQGDGILRIEMHFLPDIFVTCEACGGRRYNRETLEIAYKGRSIADLLDMTVEEALAFLENVPSVSRPLRTLHEVGLDYLTLGQPATTLSGGEAQRIKLARELSRRATGRTVYILDEPTTGLHFADVEKLLGVLGKLVDLGNTVLVIEHHLDVIKTADHVIDLGPEGGERGGAIVAIGTPEEIARDPRSHTGRALAAVLGA
ncbi:MAG: excinuclease ABC subunit UvrA, partial [Deltaproteobacteria bacterium]